MDYAVTAREILEKVGGASNVAGANHCMTRLRLTLKDQSLVDDSQVKAIKGVVGVMKKAGQYQIIIGNEVAKCYKELCKLGNFGDGGGSTLAPAKGGNPVSIILDAISGSMSPVIPAIIGADMIQVLNIILGWFLPAENQTLQLLSVIGNTAFYFLPVLVAYSAGRKFGANPVLVTAVVAILIHPNFIALTGAEGGVNFLGIPVTSFDYSSSIIPAILTAYAMSWIERGIEKITPAFTKNFLKPMLIILISSPVAFLLLGPLGSFIGGGLASVVVAIQSHASIVTYIFMAAACLAVAVKSKNGGLKQLAASSGVSALLAGVTEPGLYGVTMRLKKPLAAVCASNAVVGLFAGIMHLSSTNFATPSLLALPMFVHAEKSNNFFLAIATAVISMALSFALTWILGFKDPAEGEV